MTQTLDPAKAFYAFREIEGIRQALLKNKNTIRITDFGAGSHYNNNTEKKISTIAKNAAKPAKFGQILFKLVEHFKPKQILELGTSLGISTSYLARPNSTSKVITMEGCPETAKIATKTFKAQKLENIEIVVGNFDETLEPTMEKIDQLDFAFFDGNHQYEPTVNYFKKGLEKRTDDSIFIFDDIHWSDGMEKAWKEIKNHPEVTLTIDFFFIGLVFFRKENIKQHLVVKA